MATGFEEHVRLRATSRQDYVDRANAGVKSILESAKTGLFPNFMHAGLVGEGLVPAAGTQGQQAGPSQSSGAGSQAVNGNGRQGFSEIERTVLPDPSPVTDVGSFNAHAPASQGLSAEELQTIIAAAVSNAPVMNNPTQTPVSAPNGETPTPMLSSVPTNGQLQTVPQSSPAAAPTISQQPLKTSQIEPKNQETKTEKDGTEAVTEKPQDEPRATKPARPTSRGGPSRGSKNTPSASNNQATTPPAPKSKAKKATKRPPRKRATKGKKRTGKQPRTVDASVQSAQLGKDPVKKDDEEACPSFPENIDSTGHLKDASSSLCTFAQEHMNRKYSIAQEHMNQINKAEIPRSSQLSPSGASLNPSSNIGFNTAAQNIPTPSANNPNMTFATNPGCNVPQAFGTTPQLSSSVNHLLEATHGPSVPSPQLNGSHMPFPSNINVQNAQQMRENVRFCSNGDMEIDDGIRVCREQVVFAAASIGILLTPGQLQSMRKDQALHILVKASQFNLMRANGVLPPPSPVLPQGSSSGDRTHLVQPHAMGGVRTYPQFQGPQTSRAVPQTSNQGGIPMQPRAVEGAHLGASASTNPELRPAESGPPQNQNQNQNQRSTPLWRFAANVPEVQARLRKFQTDFKQNMGLLQGHLSGAPAETNDNLVRYLRCCVHLLSMEPIHVRGVNVEVIDSVERFLRNFLTAGATAVNAQGQQQQQQQQQVPVNGRVEDVENSGANVVTPGMQGCPKRSMSGIVVPSDNGVLNSGVVSASTGTTDVRAGVGRVGQEKEMIAAIPCDEISMGEDDVVTKSGAKARKRKSSSRHELEHAGKRGTKETGGKGKGEDGVKIVNCVDVVDMSDRHGVSEGMSMLYEGSEGNKLTFVGLSDKPRFEDLVRRMGYMLNGSMKQTTCFITVKREGERGLEEVVLHVEPRTGEKDGDEDGLSMRELIKIECMEMRKLYGRVDVMMKRECGKWVFSSVFNGDVKIVLRIGEGNGGRFERPTSGWLGVIERVMMLFRGGVMGLWIRGRSD